MPNWVEQNLHVVGSKADIDRFIQTGFIRRNKDQFDNLLDLRRLCPLKRREPKRTYTHDSAVVLMRYRTRTQAFFAMITSWQYPDEFYAACRCIGRRLALSAALTRTWVISAAS